MQKPLHTNKGFTLVETLVVIAILTIIGTITPVLGMNGIRSESFSSEIDKLATLLQKARLQAQNNLNQSNHGLLIDTENQKHYILFEGVSYAQSDKSKNAEFKIEYPIQISESSYKEIIFEKNSGRTTNYGYLIITDTESGKVSRIKINYEGQISW